MLLDTREKISNFRAEAGATDDNDKNDEDLPQTLTKSDTGVISMLTGDFLAPYLLSSVDRGKGMMKALAGTPVDYLTWGNHVSFLIAGLQVDCFEKSLSISDISDVLHFTLSFVKSSRKLTLTTEQSANT